MTKKLLFVTTILLVVAMGLWAADVTGKWTFQQEGRNGPQTVTVDLKSSGGDLTGTMAGGGGRQAEPAPISEGKVDGNNVSFKVVREFNGNKMETTFKGTVDGNSMKLDVTRPGRGGGDPTTTSVTAKKSST
jgi:hypothetical protein